MIEMLMSQLLPNVLQALGAEGVRGATEGVTQAVNGAGGGASGGGGGGQSPAPDPMAPVESAITQRPEGNVLDNVMSTLFGTPDMALSPEDLRERNGRRADAAQLARNAFQSPGEGFMDPPSVGGKICQGTGDEPTAREACNRRNDPP